VPVPNWGLQQEGYVA